MLFGEGDSRSARCGRRIRRLMDRIKALNPSFDSRELTRAAEAVRGAAARRVGRGRRRSPPDSRPGNAPAAGPVSPAVSPDGPAGRQSRAGRRPRRLAHPGRPRTTARPCTRRLTAPTCISSPPNRAWPVGDHRASPCAARRTPAAPASWSAVAAATRARSRRARPPSLAHADGEVARRATPPVRRSGRCRSCWAIPATIRTRW